MRPRRVASIARRATSRILAKRVNGSSLTIPDITSADFDNPLTVDLLECTETMDEEVESNGSVIADAPLYSKIVGIKLQGMIQGTASGVNFFRWMLFKAPDNDITGAAAMGLWHVSDDTATARELRKVTIAKGLISSGASSSLASLRVFVRRSALARIGPLSEGDVLRLAIAKDAAGTTARLELWGTIYLRANG